MRTYWAAVLLIAAAIGFYVFHHRSRPFSAEEATAAWEGHGPDPGTREYVAALEPGRRRAVARQAAAPRDAALAFFLALGAGAALGASRAVRNSSMEER